MSPFFRQKNGEGSNKIALLRKKPYFIGSSGDKNVFLRNSKDVFIPLFVPFYPPFLPSPSTYQIDFFERSIVVFGEFFGNVEIDLFSNSTILVSQASGNDIYIHFGSSE